MLIIKIYKITVTEAPQMADCNTHYSLEPWGANTREYKGYDDGGEDYRLPDKYSLGRDVSGGLRVYDDKDLEVCIEGWTHPAISNRYGLAERLGKA